MNVKRNSNRYYFILVLVCVLLCGCNKADVETSSNSDNVGKHEIYEECVFENLNTFTDVTGIECYEVIDDVSKTMYVYRMDNKADQLINQYMMYLTSDLNMDISNEDGDILYQNEEGSILTSLSNEDGYIIYTITIPVSGGKLETGLEAIYNSALQMIAEGNYKEAYDALRKDEDISSYKDSTELRYYCKGMLCKQYGEYGTAIELLDKAEDVLDAAQMAEEMRGTVSKYNGTYYADHLTYPGQNIGYYLFVQDGKAALEMESVYTPGEGVYYHYDLMEKEKIGASGSMMMLGNSNGGLDEPDEDSYKYSFMVMDNGDVMVIAYETNDYSTYNGCYTKKSDSFPNAK